MAGRWIIVLLVLALIVSGCQPSGTIEDREHIDNEDVQPPELETSMKEDEGSVIEASVDDIAEDEAKASDGDKEGVAEVQETDSVEPMELPSLAIGIQVAEMRAVWLSYLDLQPIFELGSEEAYRQAMQEVIDNSKDLGMNTLMYQVRPFGDALYPSEIFPTSYIISGEEGAPLSYDPFEIAIELVHAEDMRIEAWINPYRIRTATSTVPLSEDNQGKTWLEDGSRRVLQSSDGTIVYNPSNDEVRTKIIAGVLEIIDHYSVDGIHFDDYFYPTTDSDFDEVEYLGFFHDSDGLTQDEWRRANVNKLISQVYAAIDQTDRNIEFGISPQGDIDTNYNQLFADVQLWLSEPGYLDYVIPQIYFGFEHERSPYSETLEAWHQLNQNGAKIIPGLAVYKIGKEDQWAGIGQSEWVTSEGILSQMISEAKSYEDYAGYALFRYDYLFKPDGMLEERMGIEIEAIKTQGQ